MALRYQKLLGDQTDSVLTKIVKDIASAYDWLSGPPMTARDRLTRDLFEVQLSDSPMRTSM